MILVTGATGFVGSALIQQLAIDYPDIGIVAAARHIVGNWPPGVNLVQVEDLSPSTNWIFALQGVKVVVHCAARVHVISDHINDQLTEFRRVNVEGTTRLAQQAAEIGIQRFIFISSIKVNGEETEFGYPFTADDIPDPQDPYSISKMEAEKNLRELSARTGMEVVIIRPPLVYGPGVKANFASMVRWLRRGIPLPLGALTNNRRSLVYVENLVDLISLCVDHPNAANQIFLVSDDEDLSTTMLLRRMAKALGCPVRLINLSPMFIKLASMLVGKPEIAHKLCGSLQIDLERTRKILGWNPKFSLDEGLLRTARPIVTISDKQKF